MVDPELAYLAGFFDGEGCVTVGRGKSPGVMSLFIKVGQVNPAPLERFRQRFGGAIHPLSRYGNQRQAYQWTLSTKKAQAALEQLLPYLQVKQDEARMAIALQWQISESGRHGRKRLDPLDIAGREALYERIHQAKHFDYDATGQIIFQ